jgi:hypothetical protein
MIAPRPISCRHFNGVQFDACKVGIRFDHVRDDAKPVYRRLPCIVYGDVEPPPCPQRDLPTEAEIAAERDKSNQHAAAAMEMRAQISKLPDVAGDVVCVLCGDLARWKRAPNGHVWCRCSTEGCVRWIE